MTFADSPLEEEILFTDLLRRMERFNEAREKCTQGLKMAQSNQTAENVFNYELYLIEQRDNRCHTYEQAQEYYDEDSTE